jgi:hypothetical protein
MTRGQQTSYTGSDQSVSITQHQGADQSQLALTNKRLRGEWSIRALVERRYKKWKRRSPRTRFTPISPRGPLRGLGDKCGDAFILGYGLVRPNAPTYGGRDKTELFDQFERKDDAYLWLKDDPTYIPPSKLTPRFVIEGYGYNHRQPTDSEWGGKFYVQSADAMLSARDGFRVAAVAEVPPGTEFAYPFGSPGQLKDGLEDTAEHYEFDPHFEEVV